MEMGRCFVGAWPGRTEALSPTRIDPSAFNQNQPCISHWMNSEPPNRQEGAMSAASDAPAPLSERVLLPNEIARVWAPARCLSLVVLISATVFGLAVAHWTRAAHLPQLPRLSAAINPVSHLFVFGVWTVAWGLCWKQVFAQRGGKLLLVLVPVALAFAGEAVEVFWPGHQPDVRDVLLNLVGVGAALWMGNKLTSPSTPASNGPPGN
jgi:hypothetical protein